jgi:hypothetical protein
LLLEVEERNTCVKRPLDATFAKRSVASLCKLSDISVARGENGKGENRFLLPRNANDAIGWEHSALCGLVCVVFAKQVGAPVPTWLRWAVERALEVDQKRRTIPVACVQVISSRGHDLHAVKDAFEGQYSILFDPVVHYLWQDMSTLLQGGRPLGKRNSSGA